MKRFAALIISLLFAVPSFATTKMDVEKYIGNPALFQQPMLVCTRDLNAWGKASVCNTCPDGTLYDKRVGQCATETSTLAETVGVIESVRDEEGNIKGFAIVNQDTGESIDLVVTRALRAELEDKSLEGVAIALEGEIVSSVAFGDALLKKSVEHFVVIDEASVRSQIEKISGQSSAD